MNRSSKTSVILCRIGGESIQILEAFDFGKTNKILKELSFEKARRESARGNALLELYRCIGEESDDLARQNLVKLKRKIYDNKELHGEKNGVTLQAVNEYVDAIRAIHEKKVAGNAALQEEIGLSFRNLTKVITPNLANGLLFSSLEFYDLVNRNFAQDGAVDAKEQSKILVGLLKYLTRVAAKTSPFSSFTHLSLATLRQQVKLVNAVPTMQGLKHVVRSNNNLFRLFFELLSTDKRFRSALILKLNATISMNGGVYRFIVNSNNIEAYQFIDHNEVLDIIPRLIKGGSTLKEFGALLESEIEAETPSIESYINELIDLGFLELSIGFSGTDPQWDEKLIEFILRNKMTGEFGIVIEVLHKLVQGRKEIEHDPNAQCKSIINNVFKSLKDLYNVLITQYGISLDEEQEEFRHFLSGTGAEVFKRKRQFGFDLKPEFVYYDDVVSDISVSLDQERFDFFLAKVNHLMQSLLCNRSNHVEEVMMKVFLQFKKNAVSFLTFFESYSKEIKNSPSERSKEDALLKLKEKWENLITKSIINDERNLYHIDKVTLHKANSLIPDFTKTERSSWSILVQPFQNGSSNDFHGVINGFLHGYGRYFSRFIHLFDESLIKELREANLNLMCEDLFAEVGDASYFNGNIHPPLMPYELNIPGGHKILDEGEQLHLRDLEVKVDSSGNKLLLWHKQLKKRVYVFNLGFQGNLGRSGLFEFLQHFNLDKGSLYYEFIDSINSSISGRQEDVQGIKVFPRIVYDNCVILQRKSWTFPKSRIPIKRPSEADFDYYERIQSWRSEHNIPEAIFVRFKSREGMFPVAANSKPQFVDFKNPLLVRLFEKSLSSADDNIRIEEMLPATSQMVDVNGDKYVTEFLVQWEAN